MRGSCCCCCDSLDRWAWFLHLFDFVSGVRVVLCYTVNHWCLRLARCMVLVVFRYTVELCFYVCLNLSVVLGSVNHWCFCRMRGSCVSFYSWTCFMWVWFCQWCYGCYQKSTVFATRLLIPPINYRLCLLVMWHYINQPSQIAMIIRVLLEKSTLTKRGKYRNTCTCIYVNHIVENSSS